MDAGNERIDKRIDGNVNPRRALVRSVRERVETSFSSLWQRLIDRNLSRSWSIALLAGGVEYAQVEDAALQFVPRRILACLVNPRLRLT